MSLTKYEQVIDEHFAQDQEQARRALKDMAMIMDALDQVAESEQAPDVVFLGRAIATALYGMSNNPLGAVVAPMFRPIVLDVFRSGTHGFARRFLLQAVPSLASLMNGASPLDYPRIYESVKKGLQ